jgi:predicted ester cyclase
MAIRLRFLEESGGSLAARAPGFNRAKRYRRLDGPVILAGRIKGSVMSSADLAARRLKIICDHMKAENVLDFDAAIDTFEHPRYELVGTGQVFDGEKEVRDYYRQSRAAFPDQNNEIISLRVAGEDAIITEFWLMGTHLGPIMTPMGEFPPTGNPFKVRMCAVFEFEGDKIASERINIDRMSIMDQLTK